MKKKWTESDIMILQNMYPDNTAEHISNILQRTSRSIYSAARKMNLKKSEQFLSNHAGRLKPGSNKGISTRFKTGIKAWNKGMKGLNIGGKETQFTQGHLPANTKEDGAISIRNCKGRPYYWIRTGKGEWQMLHRIIWEKEYGPISPSINIQFKDGNSLNCTINNLHMVTKKENMSSNTIQRFPEELKSAIKLVSKLNKKIKQHGEKQDK